MTAVKSVPMPMDMSPDVAQYVGVLEGTVAALCINEARYRAFLELLTGEQWEDTRIDFNGNVLQELAVSALVRQTGMDLARAKVLVAKRWGNFNLPKEMVVPSAVSTDDFVSGDVSNRSPENKNAASASERFQAWKARQLADAAEIPSGATDSE